MILENYTLTDFTDSKWNDLRIDFDNIQNCIDELNKQDHIFGESKQVTDRFDTDLNLISHTIKNVNLVDKNVIGGCQ
jgi:hypothetical protein